MMDGGHGLSRQHISPGLRSRRVVLLVDRKFHILLALHALLRTTHNFPHTLLEGSLVVAPHDGSVNVGGRLVVGVGQH